MLCRMFKDFHLVEENREDSILICMTEHAYPFTPPVVNPPMILSCRKHIPKNAGNDRDNDRCIHAAVIGNELTGEELDPELYGP